MKLILYLVLFLFLLMSVYTDKQNIGTSSQSRVSLTEEEQDELDEWKESLSEVEQLTNEKADDFLQDLFEKGKFLFNHYKKELTIENGISDFNLFKLKIRAQIVIRDIEKEHDYDDLKSMTVDELWGYDKIIAGSFNFVYDDQWLISKINNKEDFHSLYNKFVLELCGEYQHYHLFTPQLIEDGLFSDEQITWLTRNFIKNMSDFQIDAFPVNKIDLLQPYQKEVMILRKNNDVNGIAIINTREEFQQYYDRYLIELWSLKKYKMYVFTPEIISNGWFSEEQLNMLPSEFIMSMTDVQISAFPDNQIEDLESYSKDLMISRQNNISRHIIKCGLLMPYRNPVTNEVFKPDWTKIKYDYEPWPKTSQ